MEGYLFSWLLYDLWIIGLFLYIKTHAFCFLSTQRLGILTFLILFLFIVFGEFSGDFRHYEEIVDKFSMTDQVASNFEPFYIWLMKVTGYNITVFRSVIGFGTISFCYYILKQFKELNAPAIFLFTLIPFYFLSNAIRQGVANSICLLGLFYLFYKRKKLLSVFLILISFYLHKSSILIIPTLFFLFIPLKRKLIILYFVSVLPVIYIENLILIYFTDILLGEGAIELYMTVESAETSTLLMRIMDLIFMMVVLSLAFLSLKRIYKYKNVFNNRPLRLLTRLLFGCCYMYVIYSGLQLGANYVAERFMPFMYVPLVVVMMKAYGIRILNNHVILSLITLYFIVVNLQIYRWFLVFF